MSYYFAYGSNMSQQQMQKRCPGSSLIGKAELRDYKIGFTSFSTMRNCGTADVIQSVGDAVPGLVFEVTASDIAVLDRLEGHPVDYRRVEVTVVDESGEERRVETYEVVEKEPQFQKPSKEYLGLLIEAAARFNFPKEYQMHLAAVPTI